MSGDSPVATSPLIRKDNDGSSSGDVINGVPGVVVEMPDSPEQAVEMTAVRSRDSVPMMSGWSMRYHDLIPGKHSAASAKTFR